jgi:hypothetical protein
LRGPGGLAAAEKAPEGEHEGEQQQGDGEFSPGDASSGSIGWRGRDLQRIAGQGKLRGGLRGFDAASFRAASFMATVFAAAIGGAPRNSLVV